MTNIDLDALASAPFGAAWDEPLADIKARVKGKLGKHPDDDGDGAWPAVYVLTRKVELAGQAGLVFLSYDKPLKKLASVQIRFPHARSAMKQVAALTAAQRTAAVDEITRAFGGPKQGPVAGKDFNPEWKLEKRVGRAYASKIGIADFAQLAAFSPGKLIGLVDVTISRK